jgi:hypothetical protein
VAFPSNPRGRYGEESEEGQEEGSRQEVKVKLGRKCPSFIA